MRIKTTVLAFAVAIAALFSVAAQASTISLIHPDGGARTFRGFGPTVISADGYGCTLYNELGVKVGTITHHYDDVTHPEAGQTVILDVVGGSLTGVGAGPMGVMGFGELGAIGAEIPAEYNNPADYGIMVFSARVEDGNDFDFTRTSGVLRNASVVEPRCIFIVPLHPTPGNPNMLPVFCLNCIYSIS